MGPDASIHPRFAVREPLRALVAADAALAASLADAWNPADFAGRLAAAAGGRGVDVSAAEIGEMLQHGLRAPPLLAIAPTPGWLPARVTSAGSDARVEWVWFGARRLIEPFYEESLGAVRHSPFNRLFGFSTHLAGLRAASDAPAPAGLVFHMSRCGSTLVAQMLAALPGTTVVSEAPPIDAVVRLDAAAAGLDAASHAQLLRAMVGAVGQPRAGETRLYLKLDSWHARALPLFRRAFPATPWVFLIREPVEVLVSHLRKPGMQAAGLLPAQAIGVAWQDEATREANTAAALAAICEAAEQAAGAGGGLVVNYDELPDALAARILPHFGVRPSEAEAQVVAAVAGRDAKQPGQRLRARRRRKAGGRQRGGPRRCSRPAGGRLRTTERAVPRARPGDGGMSADAATMGRLRERLAAQPALAEALWAERDASAFAARLAEAAGALGEPLTAGAIGARLALPPLGPATPAPLLRSCVDGAPAGWRPAAAWAADGGYVVDWAHLGGRGADGGFYYDEVHRAQARPFNRLFGFRSPLADLAHARWAESTSPSGLVFHMTHCGSTLVSRMLAAGEARLALGEPQPLDMALRICAEASLDEPTQLALVRGVVGALCAPRAGETQLFLKLDAWHIGLLPLLRHAFPDTPWVFLYRAPLEVMTPLLETIGLDPGRFPIRALGLDADAASLPEADYLAAALAAICELALAGHAETGGLLVNYSELPSAAQSRILPHFGVTGSPGDAAAMALAARDNAKAPGLRFAPDSAAKRAAATPEARAAVRGRLEAAYARLEAARALQA